MEGMSYAMLPYIIQLTVVSHKLLILSQLCLDVISAAACPPALSDSFFMTSQHN